VISFQIGSLREKHDDLEREVEELRDIVKELRDKGSRKRGPDAADGIGGVEEEGAKLKRRRVEIQEHGNRVCIVVE
jgi:hypothetical protein